MEDRIIRELRSMLSGVPRGEWLSKDGRISHRPPGCVYPGGYSLGIFAEQPVAALVAALVNNAEALLDAAESSGGQSAAG